jgi:Ca2+-binding EF-hand superfamily protein
MSDEEDQASEAFGRAFDDFISTGSVEAARELFNSFDKNHDNRVSKNEVSQFFSKFGPSREERERVEALYKASDANADGTLDFEEFQAFLRAIS